MSKTRWSNLELLVCLPPAACWTPTPNDQLAPHHSQSPTSGANSFGQLGLGDQIKRNRFAPVKGRYLVDSDIVTLQAGDYNSGAIGGDGKVYLWGRCARARSSLDCL